MSVAAVTLVGVLASHRRRGVLTALMRRQLDDVRAAREPVAALRSSEAAIYGRFGYGRAARIAPLYDRVRRERVGHLDRAEAWWRRRTADPEHRRDGKGPLRAAVHEDETGAVDGYVLDAVAPGWAYGPDGRAVLRELVADGARATAAMWAFVLGLDLVRTVEWDTAPPDEPYGELVSGPQSARVELRANLWIRLVDVPAALAARA